jgi:hypothetical protein
MHAGSGRFEVELLMDNKEPKLIYDKQKEGRLNSFNIAPLIKKITEAE